MRSIAEIAFFKKLLSSHQSLINQCPIVESCHSIWPKMYCPQSFLKKNGWRCRNFGIDTLGKG